MWFASVVYKILNKFFEDNIDDSQYKEIYIITDTAGTFEAKWVDIDEFVSRRKILYPELLLPYIEKRMHKTDLHLCSRR